MTLNEEGANAEEETAEVGRHWNLTRRVETPSFGVGKGVLTDRKDSKTPEGINSLSNTRKLKIFTKSY